MMATKRHHYTPKELDDAAIADLISDAECAERQSVEGPFYPERGITAESLAAYAIRCRVQADSF
jgi:hypothetical protein